MRVLQVIKVVNCDQWRQGYCGNTPQPTLCPKVRASYLPGECCHHPDHRMEHFRTLSGRIRVKVKQHE